MERARKIVLVQFSGKLSGSTISSRFVGRALRDGGAEVIYHLGFDGVFRGQLIEEGFACALAPHDNWLRAGTIYGFLRAFWRDGRCAREFRRRFAELKPDLVYVNTLASHAAAKAAHDLGIPVVWHLRELFQDAGGELMAPPVLGKSWVSRRIRRLARRTLAPSSAVCRNIFGCETLPTHRVVPNAVDVSEFSKLPTRAEARARFGLPVEAPVVGVVGTFRPVKGQDVLVRAMPEVLAKRPDAVFAFVGGEAPFRSEVRRLAEELGVADRCRFHGEVSDVAAFYAAVGLLCVPSRSESFGRTVVEAFAAGTPVVGALVGGLRDILREGENGLVFETGNSASLAAALLRGLNAGTAERERWVEAGRRDVKARYDEAAHARQIRAVVEEAIAE